MKITKVKKIFWWVFNRTHWSYMIEKEMDIESPQSSGSKQKNRKAITTIL